MKKKRFGKSIAHRSPSRFTSLLKEKVERLGGTYEEVNTRTFKASQYCHITDACQKKKLRERWHILDGGVKIQRDCYSAFLLMNAKKDGQTTNRPQCIKTFDQFLILHNREIDRLKTLETLTLNSGVRIKQAK